MELRADGRHDSYLRGELSACLTQAVTEVVLIRPADPIQHLAHCLIKYRRLHPLKTELSPREHLRSVLPGPEKLGGAEELEDSPRDNIFVHTSCRAALHSIGDIFDDDDIT